MSKVRVAVANTIGKAVQIETDAPSRTEMNAAIAAALASVQPSSSSGSYADTLWKLIREIPANIVNLAALTSAGLVTRLIDGTFTARNVTSANTGRITVTNGDGQSGNPAIDMADITARSALVRATNTDGKPAALQASGDKAVLRQLGTALVFEPMALVDLEDVVPETPADGDVLTFVDPDGWTPRPASGGGSTEPSIGKSIEATYTASITNPTTTSFRMLLQYSPMEPLAPRLQTFFDDMTQDNGYYALSGNTTTPTWVQSQLNAKSTAASFGNAMNFTTKQKFEIAGICLMLEGIVKTPDASANAFAVGLHKSNGDILFAFMETGSGTNNNITLAKITGAGTVFTAIVSTTASTLPSGISGLALEVSPGGYAVVWQNVSSQGWVPILSSLVTDWNFQSPSELAAWVPWLQVTGGVTTPWKIGSFRTGYEGQSFLRDFRIVTLKDGTPYVSDGFLYFTATAHTCGVHRLNVKSGAFEKVGQLAFQRSGVNYGDLNANILWDEDIQAWRVFWATWADGATGVRMWHAIYRGDILNGVHVVTGGSQLTLSQTSGNNATYDPAVIWDAANARWLMAYTLSPSGTFAGNFYAVLDSSSDLATWSNVFAKSGTTGYEGSWMSKMGGNLYITAGNGSNYRCWDLTGTDLGTITVDSYPSPGSNPPPHFVFFPWFDAGVTEYYALSWQNTQFSVGGSGIGVFGTGTPILYKGNNVETGFEFTEIGVR